MMSNDPPDTGTIFGKTAGLPKVLANVEQYRNAMKSGERQSFAPLRHAESEGHASMSDAKAV